MFRHDLGKCWSRVYGLWNKELVGKCLGFMTLTGNISFILDMCLIIFLYFNHMQVQLLS
jgi:hypothetical protein